jgi:hypothetical protein
VGWKVARMTVSPGVASVMVPATEREFVKAGEFKGARAVLAQVNMLAKLALT